MSELTVLSVASEAYPLVKTGGLADVVGALPAALAREGVSATTLLPGYPAVIDALEQRTTVHNFTDLHGGPAHLLAGHAAGLALLVLDAPHLYARDGNPYIGPDGTDWPDNAQRFAALGFAAAEIARGARAGYRPDIVHCHDWQSAMAIAYLRFSPGPRPATVMTVHNLAFQGQYPWALKKELGLPERAYTVDGVEYYGMIGYLKAGLALADAITTVSPTYAAEVRSTQHGMGLDGLLRMRAGVLHGILNGIDTDVWNPATDPHLAAPFDAKHLAARAANKAALQERLGLAVDPKALLFGVVSRLTWQKGTDLLLQSMTSIDAHGAQLALIGSGEAPIEAGLMEAMHARPGRVSAVIGYDESLAHLVQAGADALLVPSRFEPCGLTQLCALRYGALPVVARVGGLADTVIDANEMALAAGTGTGVVFEAGSRAALDAGIERTAALWNDRRQWRALQRRAMSTDVSWSRPAARYAALYRALAAARGASAE